MGRAEAEEAVGRVRPSGRNLGGQGDGETRGGTPREAFGGLHVADAGEPDIARLDLFGGKVLTAPGEAYALPPRQAAYVAFLDDGTLVVSRAHAASDEVTGLLRTLAGAGIGIERALGVDLECVRRVYEAHAGRAGHQPGEGRGRGFERLLAEAVKSRGSQIHIVAERFEAKVTVRGRGFAQVTSGYSGMAGKDLCRQAFDLAGVDFSYKENDYQSVRIPPRRGVLPAGVRGVELRFQPLGGEGRQMLADIAYARDAVTRGLGLDDLGYTPGQVEGLKRMRRRPSGIALLAGPQGSGRTLSMRCLAEYGARPEGRTAIVEEEPGYEIPGAVRYPVVPAPTDPERRESFRNAITHAIRSNPDVLVVGQTDSGSSAELVWKAGLMGMQVWTKVQVSDAMGTLDYLRNLGMELYRLADHTLVNGIVAQRLVRRTCPECSMTASEAAAAGIRTAPLKFMMALGLQPRYARPGHGCPRCDDGYDGQMLVAEVLVPDETFMELLADGKRGLARRHWLNELGGSTMLEQAGRLVAEGVLDPNEAERRVGLLDEIDPGRIGSVRRAAEGRADDEGLRP